jgi:hypothetical protein
VESINPKKHIVNHPTKNYLKYITLEEAWRNTKLVESHFHVFGSEALTHILEEKLKAL